MANGGIIGPINIISNASQSEVITIKTSSGSFTTQPLTESVTVLVVAGGGGSSYGAGGAGGVRIVCSPVSGATPVTVVVGGGGGASTNGVPSSITATGLSVTASGGGWGGVPTGNDGPGNPGGSGGGGGHGGCGGALGPYGGTGNSGGYTPPEGKHQEYGV
jgi:hypothetical protein